MVQQARLIVNPAAGGGRAGRACAAVEAALRGHGVTVCSDRARDLEHARALALEAARAGESVFVLGGDGLAGAIADVLRTVPGSLMAVLPGGRGNDLVRVLGLPGDPVLACDALVDAVPTPIDLGEADGRAFLGIASVGLDSDANRIANEAPAWLGDLVYAYGALRALVSWRPACFELTLRNGAGAAEETAGSPSRSIAFTGYTVAVANSKAYGGGMLMAPHASLQDGLLDLVWIEQIPKLRVVANLPKLFKGTHVEEPSVHVLRATEVEISADRPFMMYADGDPLVALPARLRVLPGAVRMLVPPTSPGAGPR